MRLLRLLSVILVTVGGPLTTTTGTTAFFVPTIPPGRSIPPVQKWMRSSSCRLLATKEATFGMGCFWKPAEEMLKVHGVLATTAGYTGNPNNAKQDPPSYNEVCFSRDWVEGVRVLYDDEKVSYEQLLDAFFQVQEPKGGSRQYASIIFPHDPQQQQVAEEWLQQGRQSNKVRNGDGLPVAVTRLEAKSPFFKAEGYHQKYWQKFRPRVATVVLLIVVSMVDWNQFDGVVTANVATMIDQVAGWGLYAMGAWVLLERVVDAQVVELE
jgi:peptide-methionine (S)-S-oxide reductase